MKTKNNIMDKTKIYLNLTMCTGEELNNIYTILGDTLKFESPSIVFNFPIMHYHEDMWIRTNFFQDKSKEDNFLVEKTEITYPEFIKLFEGGESKEDFAIYKRTFNKIPYPRVEWECNCGFKHCLNEGFERDYRKDNFKEIRLPTGRCLKCKKEIKTHPLESKEVLQVDIYSGELNTERILTYKKLSEHYNIQESTVRDIFNAGADWVINLKSNN